MSIQVLCIGECMMELQFHNPNSQGLAYGGDAYNTAYAIKQCSTTDSSVNFVSALGDDDFSQDMIKGWRSQGIATEHVEITKNRLPGLYISKTDDSGERTFSYWRQESAARDFFQSERFQRFLERVDIPQYLYFSGISLAIMSPANRECFLHQTALWRESGCQLVFDSNFREKLWSSINDAKYWIEAAWKVTHIGLPTLVDEQMLFGVESPEQAIEKLRNFGVFAGAVKLGKAGCIAFERTIPSIAIDAPTVKSIDTTGAGDAFNGAFLGNYIANGNCEQAARAGVVYASETVQRFGAIPQPKRG